MRISEFSPIGIAFAAFIAATPALALDPASAPGERRGSVIEGLFPRILNPFGRPSRAAADETPPRPPAVIPVPRAAIPEPTAAEASAGRVLAAPAVPPAAALAPIEKSTPPAAFKSIREAFSAGIKGYNSGDKVAAVHALEYAAGQGHALARWKLGRMYAEGDGVPHDDLKAFEQFSRIADEHADQPPDAPQARFVASAFVALGSYFLDGIPGSYVKANPTRARDMFFYAASYFGDPDAQYNLARLMIEGQGGAKNPRQAMRWLHLAADKGHVPSQALLGHLLFAEGKAGRAASRGLMWLMLARDGCDPVRDAWIVDLYEGAVSRASASDRQEAIALLEDHLRKR
jgi:TPR repeat protein